jgi:hypothetical protein
MVTSVEHKKLPEGQLLIRVEMNFALSGRIGFGL